MTGQVKVVAHIERMAGGTQVHLEDGNVLEEVDDVIFATGYKHDFSIIDPAFITSDPSKNTCFQVCPQPVVWSWIYLMFLL